MTFVEKMKIKFRWKHGSVVITFAMNSDGISLNNIQGRILLSFGFHLPFYTSDESMEWVSSLVIVQSSPINVLKHIFGEI